MASTANFRLGYNEADVVTGGAHSNVTNPKAIPVTPPSTSGITVLTGDVTTPSGGGSQPATLATVNPDVGTFTNPSVTVNGKGLVTAISNGSAVTYLNEYNVNTYPPTPATPGGSAATNLTAINYCIAAMNAAGGGRLLFPGEGTYAVNGALTVITVPCEVCGYNWGTTILSQTSANDGLSFQTSNPCYVHDLQIAGPGNTENTGLTFGSSSLSNSSSTVERCEILTFFIGIAAANTINNFLISNCTIGCTHCIVVGGVNSSGTVVVTSGSFAGCAAMILNCTTSGVTNGVLCMAPNGVLIQGCEMVAVPTAIRCIFQNTSAAMSDMWIINNHIECSGTGLILDGATNTVTSANHFSNIVVVGNEFGVGGPGLWGIQMASGNTANAWLQNLTIVGNTFTNCPSGCVTLYSTANGCVMSNTFLTNVATNQLVIDASCSQVLGASMNSYPNGSGGAAGGYTDSQTYTVAKLNSAADMKGARMFVTNSNATLTAGIGAVVAAGGANVVPVFSDGTNWRIG